MKSGPTGSLAQTQPSIKAIFEGLMEKKEAEQEVMELELKMMATRQKVENAVQMKVEDAKKRKASKSGSLKAKKKLKPKAKSYAKPNKKGSLFSFGFRKVVKP